jgi:microcystin-dependent protein
MEKYFLLLSIFFTTSSFAQNVGIGFPVPTEKLDVNGNIKANGLIISSPSGLTRDFLTKSNVSGTVGYRKGHGAVGVNFIIALVGIYPSTSGITSYTEQILGEIRIFAGTFAPNGWAFCNGQLLSISTNTALFSLLGATYGGNGTTNFALPDLRAAAPVSQGTGVGGNTWNLGEKTN